MLVSKGLFVAELCFVGSADALVAADTDAGGALDDAVGEDPDQFCSRIVVSQFLRNHNEELFQPSETN